MASKRGRTKTHRPSWECRRQQQRRLRSLGSRGALQRRPLRSTCRRERDRFRGCCAGCRVLHLWWLQQRGQE